MKRGTFVSLTAFALALTILACRDITRPFPFGRRTDLFPAGPIVVSPADMHGWAFGDEPAPQYDPQPPYDELDPLVFNGCAPVTACMVSGPGTPPSGSGSAQLATTGATDGKVLRVQAYAGTRLDAITELRYSTYRQSGDSGSQFALSLQLDVDYDLNDQQRMWPQGRLVFQPYQAATGTWQSWDAKAGLWWGTTEDVFKGGMPVTNPCVQASPCTWAQLLAEFPNIGIDANSRMSANGGALVLKAGAGWMAFVGNVDALSVGINGVTTTFDFEVGAASGVPILPPNFFPKSLFDSLGTVTSASSGNVYRKDVVTIDFRAGTPLAVRQAVIDSIGGVVVGGAHYEMAGEGTYYVRIQGGTLEALLDALAILHRQPQVSMAGWWQLNHPDENAYRKPVDGLGFQDWVVDSPDLDPARKNWALEYVRAPLAWGCSVGSSSTVVAVVDDKVGYTNDLTGNVYFGASRVLVTEFDQSVDYHQSPNADHGARVASVLAATGNDHQGMTGMAWHATLILRDRFALISEPGSVDATDTQASSHLLVDHLVAAGLPRPGMLTEGASIINLSMEVKWPNGTNISASEKREKLEAAQLAHESVNNAIEILAGAGRHPLFVISAGNWAVPMELSGYPAAKIEHDDQVLVVGGLDMSGGIWAQSNTGPKIDVYAPAVGVAQANGNNKIFRDESGTSFAAPLVAGTAVLLKDFDPSLTAADMLKKIKEGARFDGTISRLDAYGALKKAAERPGAPLCGNRVYAKGGDLTVQRDPTHTEVLGSIGTFPPGNGWINVLHGGHRVNVYAWPNTYTFDYAAGGWTQTPVPDFPYTPAENGGTFNGQSSRTHNGDTVFYARRNQNTIELVVSDTVNYAQHVIGSMQLPVPPTWSSDCDFEGYSTTDGLYTCRTFGYARGRSGSYRNPSSAVSPIDGSLYMAIGYQTDHEVGGPAAWYTCGTIHAQLPNGTIQDFDNHCRDTRTYAQTLDSLQIYRVPKSTGVPILLGTRPLEGPTRMAVSEDGRELLLLSEVATPTGNSWTWRTTGPFAQTQTILPPSATCIAVAIALVPTAQGPSLGGETMLSQETGPRCQMEGSQFNVPTMAPIRAASTGGRLRVNP